VIDEPASRRADAPDEPDRAREAIDGPTERDRLPGIADSLRLAAARFGTPLYVTDVTTLASAEARMRRAFPDPWLRQYSVKANDVAAIVHRIAGWGWGANVVSRGEWAIARKAGVPNGRITLEGIGKTDEDLRAVVRAARAGEPLRWAAVESADEASVLGALAAAAGRRGDPAPLDVLFRLNPDVVPETHRGLQVGGGAAKFGMTEAELSQVVESAAATGSLRPRGIHLHVGSQLGAVDAWRDAVRKALALLALIRGNLPDFDTLDVGGGMPVAPLGTPSPGPERFAREVPALLDAIPVDRRPGTMAIEPGRALVARAGWLVARVLHVRERSGRQVVLDAGMTELIRPALYGGVHPIVALTSLGRPWSADAGGPGVSSVETARVEGPICESTDELGEHVLPALQRGDLVAVRDAGAYAASQGSAYNGRPRPPQVLLETDGRLVLGRRRGTVASLG
jgi:diaminopimelate decarboxylase